MIGGFAFILFGVIVALSVLRIRSVNAGYDLQVTSVDMGEPVGLNKYQIQVNEANVYTLDDYYESHPEVEYLRAANEGAYQYVMLVSFEITKMDESAKELDPSNFVFRFEDGATMFLPSEMEKINHWTAAPVLAVNEPFYMDIPYYFADDMFNLKQQEHLDKQDYRITWGVYPLRNEIHLNEIGNWENTLGKAQKLEQKEEESLTDAEGYAMLMDEYGLNSDNMREPGETAVFEKVTYEVKSAKMITNVSQIPDYSETYQPQPEWMKPGADMPEITEEWDYRGDFIREHNYMLTEVELTNNSSSEQDAKMIQCRVYFERGDDLYPAYQDPLYVSGGATEYGGSYSYHVILQPGESRTIYLVYDIMFDIDPTGINDQTELGQPTEFFTEEEIEKIWEGSFYFTLISPMVQEVTLNSKSCIFMEMDVEDTR